MLSAAKPPIKAATKTEPALTVAAKPWEILN